MKHIFKIPIVIICFALGCKQEEKPTPIKAPVSLEGKWECTSDFHDNKEHLGAWLGYNFVGVTCNNGNTVTVYYREQAESSIWEFLPSHDLSIQFETNFKDPDKVASAAQCAEVLGPAYKKSRSTLGAFRRDNDNQNYLHLGLESNITDDLEIIELTTSNLTLKRVGWGPNHINFKRIN